VHGEGERGGAKGLYRILGFRCYRPVRPRHTFQPAGSQKPVFEGEGGGHCGCKSKKIFLLALRMHGFFNETALYFIN
jgi:hypothetical protein